MEIPAKMEVDDVSKNDKNDHWMRLKKFRQTFHTARRFSYLQQSFDNTSHEHHHLDKT